MSYYFALALFVGLTFGVYDLYTLDSSDYLDLVYRLFSIESTVFTMGFVQGIAIYTSFTFSVFGLVGILISIIRKDDKKSLINSAIYGIFLAFFPKFLLHEIAKRLNNEKPEIHNLMDIMNQIPINLMHSGGILIVCILSVYLIRKVRFTWTDAQSL